MEGVTALTAFQAFFAGYLIGAFATMICIWLAGGELSGRHGEAPDDAATSEPGQTKSDRNSIPQEAGKCKRKKVR